MYKKILIALDDSELSEKAVGQGLGLAKKLGSGVVLFTAVEPWFPPGGAAEGLAFDFDEQRKAGVSHAKKLLTSAAEKAKRLGVPCERVYSTDEIPAKAIMRVAGEQGCDLIVMASHGRRALERMLLGSETLDVLTHGTVPVLVCR